MGIRRRQQHEEDDTPLDEDEQAKIVEDLQSQLDSHHIFIQQVFRGICWLASILCIASGVFLHLRTGATTSLLWVPTAMSSLLHFQTPPISVVTCRAHSNGSVLPFRLYATVFIMSLVLAAVCIGRLRPQKLGEELMLHQGLVLGNIVSLVLAVYLKYDVSQAMKEIHDLKASKYRFKSL